MTLDDKVSYVAELVGFLYDRTQSAVCALALVRAADAALVNQTDSFETRMMRLNQRATAEFLAIRVARMLDPAEQGNACLPEVFKVLADSAIRNAVLESLTPTPRAQREPHLDTAFRLWDHVSRDPRREKLRKLRSHTLAHNLIHKTLKDGQDGLILSIPTLGEYAEECFAVMGELAWAFLGTNELDAIRTEAQLTADRIWYRVCGPVKQEG